MLNRLRHRLGYLTFLLLFLPSLVITSVGEARAHGAASMVGVESSLHENVEGHGHTHGHEHEDSRHLHNESGSHFQKGSAWDRHYRQPNFRDALRLGERSGLPLRRVYRLERPPRPVITG